MTRLSVIATFVGALFVLTASSASAASLSFHGTFRENFLRAPVDVQCPDSDACGPGAVERYGPAFEKEFDSDQGFSRVITLDDGSGTLVLHGTGVVLRECSPPAASGSTPGSLVSFGNPFSCAGYVRVDTGAGVFAEATGILLEKIYSGGDAIVITDEGTLTIPD